MGLTAAAFPWEKGVLGVEVGGPPLLLKAACSLTTLVAGLFWTSLAPEPAEELFELTGG